MTTYYLLKTLKTEKIPSYIQIRDEELSLIAHFREDKMDENLPKLHLYNKELKLFILQAPYGKIIKIVNPEEFD